MLVFCCASNQKINSRNLHSRYVVGSLNPIKLCNLRFRILLEWSEHGKTLTTNSYFSLSVFCCQDVFTPTLSCICSNCLMLILCAQKFCYCRWLLPILWWCSAGGLWGIRAPRSCVAQTEIWWHSFQTSPLSLMFQVGSSWGKKCCSVCV